MSNHTLQSQSSLREEVEKLEWVHSIDLGGGVVTPGKWRRNPLIARALDDIDFSGKKVLDIGCWDGLWSFEAERRGAAEIYATDYVSQRPQGQPTFQLAHTALGSKAVYHPQLSVYNVADLGIRDFDVVLFCGVYYHLKYPLLALARLRQVMKDGGLLLVEGEVVAGKRSSFARFHYKNYHASDASNWWVPSKPCLKEWVESSFFEIAKDYDSATNPYNLYGRYRQLKQWLKLRIDHRYSRSVLLARAVSRKDPHYPFPDDELREFDLNEYA